MLLPLVVSVLIFLAIVLGAAGWKRLGERRAELARERLKKYAGDYQRVVQEEPLAALRRGRLAGIPQLEAALGRRRWALKLDMELERAGVQLKVSELVLIQGISAVLTAFIVVLLTGILIAGALGLVVGVWLPHLWLQRKKAARLRRLQAQLPELISMLSGGLRAGFGLMQAVDQAATQLDPPLAVELHRMLRDMAIGSTAEEAFVALNQRVGSYDFDVVVTAILIQRATGGNLAEILDGVGHTIRERERVQGEVRALTSQQRMTGLVLIGLPVLLGLLFFVMNRPYMMPLFVTVPGRVMLAVGVAGEVLGWFVIRRILAIDV